ncbi:DUF6233 domain-containing protein [Streptomyces sp. NPDC059072]|uniref:DUF6233 domain-containing protein n=1 Tax=unclassified Streptomyces TaxID=2593676 RepID=UPI0036835EDC
MAGQARDRRRSAPGRVHTRACGDSGKRCVPAAPEQVRRFLAEGVTASPAYHPDTALGRPSRVVLSPTRARCAARRPVPPGFVDLVHADREQPGIRGGPASVSPGVLADQALADGRPSLGLLNAIYGKAPAAALHGDRGNGEEVTVDQPEPWPLGTACRRL